MILRVVLLFVIFFISASVGSEEIVSQCQKDHLVLLIKHSEVLHQLNDVSERHEKLKSKHLEVDSLQALINQKNGEILRLKDEVSYLRKSTQLREEIKMIESTEMFENQQGNITNHTALPDRCPDSLDEYLIVQELQIPGSDPFKVVCYSADWIGSGWMIVYKKRHDVTNFNRTYEEYVRGFGDVGTLREENYFIGLERLHLLTNRNSYELRLGSQECAKFVVGNRSEGYVVKDIEECSGDASESIKLSKFSTWDRDQDGNPDRNWAKKEGYGWWFNSTMNRLFHSVSIMIRRKD
nr:fibrinogen-like protein 1 [Drosophila bipectinata]